MNPLSLLKPDIAILPFVNFFSAPTESTTAKKSPSASAVEVVNKFKSILAIGTVPLAKLEALKKLNLLHLLQEVLLEILHLALCHLLNLKRLSYALVNCKLR
jgi:hypothetical protein